MFSGFNLKLLEDFFENKYDYYIKIGKKCVKSQIEKYNDDLQKYVMCIGEDREILNGNKIQNDWFPQISADIFISHSHDDEDLANAFAGWLYDEFKLTSFIDSNAWGYVDELLTLFNKEYSQHWFSKEVGLIYSLEDCNRASQHANIMLLMALQNMIDKVESVFLLNTHRSIDVFEGNRMNRTYSPWIYSEIVCTQLIRKRPLINYRGKQNIIAESFAKSELSNNLQIQYDVSLEHLKSLDEDKLNLWNKKYKNGNYTKALDALYEFTYKKQLKETRELLNQLGVIYG
ncbi:MAG: hypothetical protein V8T22_05435 [Oscillospiraceae bacterium]